MARRLQILLSPTQYDYLTEEARRSSVSVAELIRRAIDTTYAPSGPHRVQVITHTLGRLSGIRLPD